MWRRSPRVCRLDPDCRSTRTWLSSLGLSPELPVRRRASVMPLLRWSIRCRCTRLLRVSLLATRFQTPALALATGAVTAAVPADADSLPLLPRGNAGPHFIDDACHFMSGNARILNSWPESFFREHVAVADATGLHLNAHLSCTRLRNLALDKLEICSGFRNLRRLHWCHLWGYRYSQRCHMSSYNFQWLLKRTYYY